MNKHKEELTMSPTVIELSRYQTEPVRTAATTRSSRASKRARMRFQALLSAAELLVTAAIGVCVLFCLGLTVSML